MSLQYLRSTHRFETQLKLICLSMTLLSLLLVGCDDDPSTPEVKAGEVVAGEVMAGEVMAGEMMSGLPINQLIPLTAQAMCQGLLGCCDMGDQDRFFVSFRGNPRYEEIQDQLPPTVTFDEQSCPGMIESILTTAPFGEWITQVQQGNVGYDGEVAQTCLNTLQNASCGQEFIDALNDGTCLSAFPPFGGEEQRKMFERTRSPGEACSPLTDGQGGVLYGTCDPTAAFCCVRRDDGSCRPGFQGEVGECVAVSQLGQACNFLPELQLCSTGIECSVDGVCEAPQEVMTVQLGDRCAENYSAIAECAEGFCDSGNTDQCIPKKADGESCIFPIECAGGDCFNGVCAQDSFCR